MKYFFSFIFIFLFFTAGLSQNLSMKGHNISATSSNKIYQLYVSLPSNYNKEDDKRYPVLFLLDAYYSYPLVSSLYPLLAANQEVEDVILVALGDQDQSQITWYKNRMINYTPSNDSMVDQEIAAGLGISSSEIQTGKAKEFLTAIREDIIPYIDQTYKTTKERGIVGHSVGGLFVAYSFIHAHDLFCKFGINSPSLFWNDNELIKETETYLQKNNEINASLFVSTAALEPEIITSSVQSFVSLIQQYKPKKLFLVTKIFEEETHTSVIGVSLTRSLKTLYSK